jgi:hypothetical protein
MLDRRRRDRSISDRALMHWAISAAVCLKIAREGKPNHILMETEHAIHRAHKRVRLKACSRDGEHVCRIMIATSFVRAITAHVLR